MRIALLALAASVAIHLAALSVLVLLPAEPVVRPPAESRPIVVELREVPAPSTGVPALGAAVRRGMTHRRDRGGTPPSRPSGAAAPSHGVTSDERAEGLALAPSERTPDLRVRLPALAPEAATDGETHSAPPGDALRESLRDLAGRSRVESGMVHPYYRDVGHALLGAWDAERAVKKQGLSGYVAQARDNVVDFGRSWHRAAKSFARTGAPDVVDGSSARMKELSGLPAGPASDALVRTEVLRQLRIAFSEGHVTTVRVTQAADGHLLSLELVSPSKDPEIDRAALADVRAAAQTLPVPPPEALRGRTRLVSIWELEVEVSITPPIPVVSVELDEVLGLTDVRVPLDRRVWKRIRLAAAD